MDHAWIKNLANSKFMDGAWYNQRPEDAQLLSQTRAEEAMAVLFAETSEAIRVFNRYGNAQKQIKIYKLTDAQKQRANGFMLLLARIQLKIEYSPQGFYSHAYLLQGPKTAHWALHTYNPHFDPFGDVCWFSKSRGMMKLPQIVNQLLEDLCRIAYETGCID